MLESAHEPNPWTKPTSAATKKTTTDSPPFVKQYTFHLDPSRDEHVLMANELSAKLAAPNRNQMEEKQRENSSTTRSSGSPRSATPSSNLPSLSGIESIWNEGITGSPPKTSERRQNELSSDDEIDDGGLGNSQSKAGFISRRPSMTAELETRIRQVRLSEGADLDRQSGPSSPSAASKWAFYGMNWTTQNSILGERNTPPQEQNQPPISPLARFQHSPFDPPAPRQVSPSNAAAFSPSRPRFQPSQTIDPQRAQRSQSFSAGDHGGYGNAYLGPVPQSATLGHRSALFGEEQAIPSGGVRYFKGSGSTFPASPLARAPIAEEVDEFDASVRPSDPNDTSPSRYQDRGRSLSTSAASHGFTRQQMGEREDAIDEALYEEDEDAALQEFEPLSRSRTLPAETSVLGFGGSRFSGLGTERERLERQRGARQSPRVVEDVPPIRRQESFSQVAWDESRAHRSPPRAVDYPVMQSSYDPYDSPSTMIDSPASMHSFPGARDYPSNSDVQNYFTNDQDRRRQTADTVHAYQMQNRFRYPTTYQGHETQRPFPFHDPDQYTLHIVKFKANRTDVFYLAKEKKLDLQVKDYVIVDGDRGTDLGMVSKVNVTEAEARALTAQLQRELAAATAANQNGMGANAMEAIAAAASQVNERDVTIPKKFIHRLAVRGEIDGLQMKMQDEAQAKQVCEMKVQQRNLQMDILDVEYQWDRRKLYIYFIAPQRVDFVALVKDLFKIYKTRIWLHNSTASHVTSQPNFLQSQAAQQETHDYHPPHLQPQYDYYRTQPRQSPGQQQYYPMQNPPLFSPNYYSPQQQYYSPTTRTYAPPQMPFQSTGPPPPGHW